MKNYYETLGVERDVDEQQLKSAYRKLAQEWHPDKHQDDDKKEEAEEKFKEISEAYAVLSDEEQRRNYDATGSPEGRGPFGSRHGGFRTTGDPFEIFRKFGGFDFQAGPRQPRPMKGQNVQELVEISLKESLFGSEIKFDYHVTSSCDVCKGRGATEFEPCEVCYGQGGAVYRQRNMVMQQTCGKCRGQGEIAKTICAKCAGRCMVGETKFLNIVIPRGISNGTNLRLAGQGGRGFNGGPKGDLLLVVKVKYPDLGSWTEKERRQLDRLLSK